MANTTLATVTTKSALVKKDYHMPISGPKQMQRVLGMIGRLMDVQQVAAGSAVSSTNKYTARHEGRLTRIEIDTVALAASGETMIFDVQKNGTTVLTATPEIVHTTTPVGLYDVSSLIVAGTFVSVGDIISIIRTAAGQSTLAETGVSVEWGG